MMFTRLLSSSLERIQETTRKLVGLSAQTEDHASSPYVQFRHTCETAIPELFTSLLTTNDPAATISAFITDIQAKLEEQLPTLTTIELQHKLKITLPNKNIFTLTGLDPILYVAENDKDLELNFITPQHYHRLKNALKQLLLQTLIKTVTQYVWGQQEPNSKHFSPHLDTVQASIIQKEIAIGLLLNATLSCDKEYKNNRETQYLYAISKNLIFKHPLTIIKLGLKQLLNKVRDPHHTTLAISRPLNDTMLINDALKKIRKLITASTQEARANLILETIVLERLEAAEQILNKTKNNLQLNISLKILQEEANTILAPFINYKQRLQRYTCVTEQAPLNKINTILYNNNKIITTANETLHTITTEIPDIQKSSLSEQAEIYTLLMHITSKATQAENDSINNFTTMHRHSLLKYIQHFDKARVEKYLNGLDLATWGLAIAAETPEIQALKGLTQNKWHPEKDAHEHTLNAFYNAAIIVQFFIKHPLFKPTPYTQAMNKVILPTLNKISLYTQEIIRKELERTIDGVPIGWSFCFAILHHDIAKTTHRTPTIKENAPVFYQHHGQSTQDFKFSGHEHGSAEQALPIAARSKLSPENIALVYELIRDHKILTDRSNGKITNEQPSERFAIIHTLHYLADNYAKVHLEENGELLFIRNPKENIIPFFLEHLHEIIPEPSFEEEI